MSQSTIFQFCRDRIYWVEAVLSNDKCVLLKDTTQWRPWGSNPWPLGLESSTLPLSHCAPSLFTFFVRGNMLKISHHIVFLTMNNVFIWLNSAEADDMENLIWVYTISYS